MKYIYIYIYYWILDLGSKKDTATLYVTQPAGMLYYPFLFAKPRYCYRQQNCQNNLYYLSHTSPFYETTHGRPRHPDPWKKGAAKGQQLVRWRGHGERSASRGFRTS